MILIPTIISALAAVIAAAVTIFLTKQKEREAVWRAKKLAYYEEFLEACSGVVGKPQSQAKTRFANAVNNLNLIGSAGVIRALHGFCDEIAVSNQHKSKARHDALWSRLVWEIRADLGDLPTEPSNEFRAMLWGSDTPSDTTP